MLELPGPHLEGKGGTSETGVKTKRLEGVIVSNNPLIYLITSVFLGQLTATRRPRSSTRNSRSKRVPPPRGNLASTVSQPACCLSVLMVKKQMRPFSIGQRKLTTVGELNMNMLEGDWNTNELVSVVLVGDSLGVKQLTLLLLELLQTNNDVLLGNLLPAALRYESGANLLELFVIEDSLR